MARELSEESIAIRDALEKFPDLGPTALASRLGVEVGKVNAQKQAMRKPATASDAGPSLTKLSSTLPGNAGGEDMIPVGLVKGVTGLLKSYSPEQLKTVLGILASK